MAYNQIPFIEARETIKAHVVRGNVEQMFLENITAKANKYYFLYVRENLQSVNITRIKVRTKWQSSN